MTTQQRVLITGATGRTGQLVVAALKDNPDWTVRVLVRTLEQAESFKAQGLETALGDLRDSATSWADGALRDVHTVISTLGGTPFTANSLWKVDYEGTQRLIAAARTETINHYIFVSTMGLRRQRSLLHPLSVLFYPKLLAEDVIRRSGLDYTIIRPGGLTDSAPATGRRNTRAQVAAACIAALDQPELRNQTWEMTADCLAAPDADPHLGVAVDPDAQ